MPISVLLELTEWRASLVAKLLQVEFYIERMNTDEGIRSAAMLASFERDASRHALCDG